MSNNCLHAFHKVAFLFTAKDKPADKWFIRAQNFNLSTKNSQLYLSKDKSVFSNWVEKDHIKKSSKSTGYRSPNNFPAFGGYALEGRHTSISDIHLSVARAAVIIIVMVWMSGSNVALV